MSMAQGEHEDVANGEDPGTGSYCLRDTSREGTPESAKAGL
jgi:hypothetical protein